MNDDNDIEGKATERPLEAGTAVLVIAGEEIQARRIQAAGQKALRHQMVENDLIAAAAALRCDLTTLQTMVRMVEVAPRSTERRADLVAQSDRVMRSAAIFKIKVDAAIKYIGGLKTDITDHLPPLN